MIVPRLLLVALAAFALGCNQGTPYAFQLLAPGEANRLGLYLPYWFWHEVETFETWSECERARRVHQATFESWKKARARTKLDAEAQKRLDKAVKEKLQEVKAKDPERWERLVKQGEAWKVELVGERDHLWRLSQARCVPVR